MSGLKQMQLATYLQLKKSSLNRNSKRFFEKELLTRIDFPAIKCLCNKYFHNYIFNIPEKILSKGVGIF